MSSAAAIDPDDLPRRASAEAKRLLFEGFWSTQRNEELDALFARCAEQALRVPALAERALRLRRLGRKVLPPALRPVVRATVVRLDRLSRRIFELVADRRRSH